MGSRSYFSVSELRLESWSLCSFPWTVPRIMPSLMPSTLLGMPSLLQALILVVGAQFKYTPSDASSAKILHDQGASQAPRGQGPHTFTHFCSPHSIGTFREMSCPRVPKVLSWQEEIFYIMFTMVRPWEGNMNSNRFLYFLSFLIKKLFVFILLYSIIGKSRIPFQISTNSSTDLSNTCNSGVLYRQTSTDPLTAHSCLKFYTI